jgi:D-alanyl-D-alanine carboxypeptidase
VVSFAVTTGTDWIRDYLGKVTRMVIRDNMHHDHTGRALDLNTSNFPALEEEFQHSQAFQWLIQNADKFGFRPSYPRGSKDPGP